MERVDERNGLRWPVLYSMSVYSRDRTSANITIADHPSKEVHMVLLEDICHGKDRQLNIVRNNHYNVMLCTSSKDDLAVTNG